MSVKWSKGTTGTNFSAARGNSRGGLIGLSGMSNKQLKKCVQHYGTEARVELMLQKNPYELVEVQGIGFKTADKIGIKLGIELSDPRRLRAAVSESFGNAEQNEGHCWLTRSQALKQIIFMMSVDGKSCDRETASSALDGALKDGLIVDEDRQLYKASTLRQENQVAEFVTGAANSRDESLQGEDLSAQLPEGFQNWKNAERAPDENQVQGVLNAAFETFSIITGGPGVGKTHTIKGILALGEETTLLAFTHRAKKRMAEVTNHVAQTIDSFVSQWMRAIHDPLFDAGPSPEIVVVDEASMVRLEHMAKLCFIVRELNARLVLVGDPNQLPAIGAGQILHDLIESRSVPTTHLTVNYRSGEQEGLVMAEKSILVGEVPPEGNGFDVIDTAGTQGEEWIAGVQDIVRQLEEEYPDVYVICTTNVARFYLNKAIQAHRNPRKLTKGFNQEFVGREWLKMGGQNKALDYSIRIGDPVSQIVNDKDRGVNNGDLGVVEEITLDHVTVDFGGHKVSYKIGDVDENLTLAYAFTVHKAQGQQYKAVVVAIPEAYRNWPERSLMYTAVTRAEEYCLLVGPSGAMRTIVRNDARGGRQTNLVARIASADD